MNTFLAVMTTLNTLVSFYALRQRHLSTMKERRKLKKRRKRHGSTTKAVPARRVA